MCESEEVTKMNNNNKIPRRWENECFSLKFYQLEKLSRNNLYSMKNIYFVKTYLSKLIDPQQNSRQRYNHGSQAGELSQSWIILVMEV
jgi:hypothetical protein